MKNHALPPHNLVWRWVDDLLVVCQNEKPPSQAEWDGEMEDLRRRRSETRAALVYTAGGFPNSKQRAQLREAILINGEYLPTVIMMDSVAIRSVISAINLFLRNRLKIFSLGELEPALLYLEIPKPRWPVVRDCLTELQRETGLLP